MLFRKIFRLVASLVKSFVLILPTPRGNYLDARGTLDLRRVNRCVRKMFTNKVKKGKFYVDELLKCRPS